MTFQPETEAEPAPAELAVVGVYPSEAALAEHGLVVLATDHPYWIFHDESTPDWRLAVEPGALGDVREQLERYDRESASWPPAPRALPAPARPVRFGSALVWALIVLAVYRAQVRRPGLLESLGSLDSAEVFDRGQLWRPFTALFLHADAGHLVSNLVAGVGVFAAVGATFNRFRGWLLLGISSYVGNLASAALHSTSQAYASVGASTAVFAGLGLLTGGASRTAVGTGGARPWRELVTPMATGLILLALYGAGDAHTDVGAHATGFAAGLVFGYFGVPRANLR